MTKNNIIPFLIFISFIIGLVLSEDTLGGGKHDYLYHEKYFLKFFQDFKETFHNFGTDLVNENVRNSPVFYIIFSQFLKLGISIENLKFINLIIIFPLIFFFYKCIEIKYPKANNEIKIFLISILFLSPTIRTLLIWPYPFLWGLTFFIISIFFYLKFESEENYTRKFKLSLYNTSLVAIAAYFTPNFAVFSIFFFYKFYLTFKNSKQTIFLIFLNLILAIPAIFFLISKDFYLFYSDGVGINSLTRINPANKIIIILNFIFLFFLPIIPKLSNLKFYLKSFKKSNLKIFFITVFILINIYFFNFLDNAGGGLFYHVSNLYFDNSIIVFFVFIVTVFFFYFIGANNLNNLLIFFILIIFNTQFSIYYKYFDPLLVFVFLFLFKFQQRDFINLERVSKRYLYFYLFFLCLNFSKIYVNY